MASPLHVVAAVLRDTSERVLIQQRPPGKHLAGYWEFPGGKVQHGEAAWAALTRELHEELGISATAGQPLITLHHTYPEHTVRLQIWDVDHWTGSPSAREKQVLRWLADGDLHTWKLLPADAPVVTALQLPHTYLITPDISSPVSEFIRSLVAAVNVHRLRLVTLRQTICSDADYHFLASAVLDALTPLGCKVLLHGNPVARLPWVTGLGAAGFHLRASDHFSSADRQRAGQWLAMSCHNRRQLQKAAAIGVDFALLGSVAATSSHPGVQPLGWQKFAAMVDAVNFPVYAIGGMQLTDVSTGRGAGAQGIAAISSLWMR